MSTTDNLRSTVNPTIGDPLTQLWQSTSEVTRSALDAYVTGLDALVEQQTAVQHASEQWLAGIFTAGSAVSHEADAVARTVGDVPASSGQAASSAVATRKTSGKTSARSRSRARRTPAAAAAGAGAGAPARKRTSSATARRRGVPPAAKAALADAVGPALSRWTTEGYDSLTAAEIIEKLPQFSQLELGEVELYEKAHQARQTILQRLETLRGPEPWDGYDELTVPDIETRIAAGDNDLASRVRDYERLHKGREGVLGAVGAKLASEG
jgi:cobalamin biosynthesis Mg chelatase CobN